MTSVVPPYSAVAHSAIVPPPSDLPDYDVDDVPITGPTFKFGAFEMQSFVTLGEAQVYLRLLAAFRSLKQKAEEEEWRFEGMPSPDMLPLREVKWVLFVERSVRRFCLWMEKLETSIQEGAQTDSSRLLIHDVPPIDVIMILHTLMLNPTAFYESSLRTHNSLKNFVANFPWGLAMTQISEDFTQIPNMDQVEEWQTSTQTPFIPPFHTESSDTQEVTCPACSTVTSAPWITIPTLNEDGSATGKGYVQNGFVLKCSNESCGRSIDRDMLCVGRLISDLASAASSHDKMSVCASTLVRPASGMLDTSNVPKTISVTLALELIAVANDDKEVQSVSIAELGDFYKWKMAEIHKTLKLSKELNGRDAILKYGLPRIPPLMAAYSYHLPFSIDLVGATLRLGTFTDAIPQAFLTPGREDENAAAVKSAIERYHKFLFLHGPTRKSNADENDESAAPPSRVVFVPTVDIDLVWHTHMLRPKAYRKDIRGLLGRVLRHDDHIEEGKHLVDFAATQQKWKANFQAPYSVCTCLDVEPPTPKASGRSGFWKKKPANAGKVTETPAAAPNCDPLFQHPSDHNTVVVCGDMKLDWIKDLRDKRVDNDSRRAKVNDGTSDDGSHQRAFAYKFHPNASDADSFGRFGLQGWALAAQYDPRVVNGTDEIVAMRISGRTLSIQQLLSRDGRPGNIGRDSSVNAGSLGVVSGGVAI